MADVFGNYQCSDQKDPPWSFEFLYGRPVGNPGRGSHIKLILRSPHSTDTLPQGWEAIFDCVAMRLKGRTSRILKKEFSHPQGMMR